MENDFKTGKELQQESIKEIEKLKTQIDIIAEINKYIAQLKSNLKETINKLDNQQNIFSQILEPNKDYNYYLNIGRIAGELTLAHIDLGFLTELELQITNLHKQITS